MKYCVQTTKVIRTELPLRYGLRIPPEKGHMGAGTQVKVHLGMTMNTIRMTFTAPEKKIQMVERMSRQNMRRVRAGRRNVGVTLLRSFAGVCQSVPLVVSETRLRLRAIQFAAASSKGPGATLMKGLSSDSS